MEALAAVQVESVMRELNGYLCRLVVRPALAEELASSTLLKALEHAAEVPPEPEAARAWLFRVATNLALDELRRHRNWREQTLPDLRELAESRPEFRARSVEMIGTPETKAIAREHLVACFSCTLRNLSGRQAAALLLREVYGFSLDETAGILDCTAAQAKNWLQESRRDMKEKYEQTCALIRKEGVCHQCVELDGFMQAGQGAPLDGKADSIRQRIELVRTHAAQTWGPWHRMLFQLLDDLQ